MTNGGGQDRTEAVTLRGPSLASLVFQSTRHFVTTAIATLTLLYLLLAAGDLFLIKLITILPRLEDKVAAVELSRELERRISRVSGHRDVHQPGGRSGRWSPRPLAGYAERLPLGHDRGSLQLRAVRVELSPRSRS